MAVTRFTCLESVASGPASTFIQYFFSLLPVNRMKRAGSEPSGRIPQRKRNGEIAQYSTVYHTRDGHMKSSLILPLIGALLLVTALVAGCVGSSPAATASGMPDTTPAQISTQNTEPATVSMDKPLTVVSGDKAFEITILSQIRGSAARSLIKGANEFNPEPEDGAEFLLLQVNKQYCSGTGADDTTVFEYRLFAGGDGVDPIYVVMPDSHMGYPDLTLHPGDAARGWILFQVPHNEEVMLAYAPTSSPAGFIRIKSEIGSTPLSRPDDLLPPRGAYTYMDAKKSNELSITYQYTTFRQTLTYETGSGSKLLKAPDGDQFLLAFVKAIHMGNRDGKNYLTQTPYPSSFRLYGQDVIYTPVVLADKTSDHTSIGELYASAFLDRKECKEGFLVFQVPEAFRPDDGYLGLNLGVDHSNPSWSLA
ncbi:MAG: hypothetical protein Q7V06_03645 [Methanocalculus sp.]|nr:hypothetical protein [Methanocalculus sp.]